VFVALGTFPVEFVGVAVFVADVFVTAELLGLVVFVAV